MCPRLLQILCCLWACSDHSRPGQHSPLELRSVGMLTDTAFQVHGAWEKAPFLQEATQDWPSEAGIDMGS